MTTSKAKAAGSAAERVVAHLVGGVRVGQLGGPTDVELPGYASIQVKTLKSLPSLTQIMAMLLAMPQGLLRAVVILERKGQGRKGLHTITFDLDEWVQWHGRYGEALGSDAQEGA